MLRISVSDGGDLPPDNRLHRERANWLAENPFSDFPPAWLNPPARELQAPANRVEAAALAQRRAELDAAMNRAGAGEYKSKTTHRQRREIEKRLAVVLREWGYLDLAERMEHCRLSGHWGEHAEQMTKDGRPRLVLLWDYKCGLTKLCPDEARIEQRRLVRRYVAPAKRWAAERGTRRIQKGVITWPNVARGKLSAYLRAMPRETAELLSKFPVIRGAIQTIETPLSARGDWNLHNNVVLLVEGLINWGEVGRAWHAQTKRLFPDCPSSWYQVDFHKLPRHHEDPDALAAALRECIKYPVKHVTEKANERKNIGDKPAGGCGGQGSKGPCESSGGVAARSGVGGGERGAGRLPGAIADASGPGLPVDVGAADVLSAASAINARHGPAVSDDGGYGSYQAVGFGEGKSCSSGAAGDAGNDRCGDGVGDAGNCGCGSADPAGGLAPALIDWGADAFAEWWDAHKRFRRTRSYGVLFSLAGFWWRRLKVERRAELLRQVGGDPGEAHEQWRALSVRGEQRSQLAELVERRERGKVPTICRGRLWWDARAKAYAVAFDQAPRAVVGLIQGDKSARGPPPQDDKSAAFASGRLSQTRATG